MKKKILAAAMAGVLVFSLVGCSVGDSNEEGGSKGDATVGDRHTEAALDILCNIWAGYDEEEKFFAVGGDLSQPVENAPGSYSLENSETLQAQLLVTTEAAEMIDEAASLIHSMNTNNFTGAAFHLKNLSDARDFADSMKESFLNNHWMCGSPDEYVIYLVEDEYVVTAYGTMDIMRVFKEKCADAYGDSTEVLAEDKIAF